MTQGFELVMAVFPNARGIAYSILEGPKFAIDWGATDVAAKRRLDTSPPWLSHLIDRYSPDILVVRKGSPRAGSKRLADLTAAIGELANAKGIAVAMVSRKQVQKAFAHVGSPTRYAIAQEIARKLPAFAPLLPPKRKIWKGENRRMGLFDAAALAFSYFASSK